MAQVKFNLKTWKKWLGDVSFEKAAMRGLKSGAMRALPTLHKATDNAPPASPNGSRGANSSGKFRKSWKTSTLPTGIALFNDAPYAPTVEGGRRKGAPQPPSAAIEQWARRRAGMTAKEAKAAAFLIARAIKRRGLKARNILRDSLPQIKKQVIQEVERELRAELKKK